MFCQVHILFEWILNFGFFFNVFAAKWLYVPEYFVCLGKKWQSFP